LRVRVDLLDGQGIRLLEPDQPITSTPYALAAELAQLAERATEADGVRSGSITASMLQPSLLKDLNRTTELGEITRDMLPQDVRNDLNATISRERLSADVRADLNRTVRLQDLSPEVSQSINRSITLSDLDSQVITELNNSIATGSISLDQLSQQVRDDLNRTITKSMLSQEVLNELNSSSGGGGVVPGSLLAVPKNQSAPSGYELYQRGDKDLVWEEKAPVSVARYASDGVEALDGKIYFVGGYTDSSNYDITERYDPLSNTWENLANISVARKGVACEVLAGKLYAIGGEGLTSVEMFDPSNGSWSTGVSLPSEVNRGTAITVNGKIYLIGGRNASSQRINQVLSFDPSISQWSTKANMPTAREAIKPVWFENRIWAIGGYDGSPLNLVESYDPTTDTWQVEASLTKPRNWPVAWVANGRIYVGGGHNGSYYLNSIEVYDSRTKQWASAGNFPENKHAADAVVLNDKAYVVAGATASGVYSNKVFAADLNASVSGVFDLYRKDGNASSGVPVAQVANGSITTNQLSEQILKYLKPEITQQPTAGTIFADTNGTFSVSAEGKYLTYQWKKNGTALDGETNATLTITDANATQHEGNYTVVVSNDFGSVESGQADMDVWNVGDDVSNVSLWLDASNVGSFELSSSVIQNWRDLSGNGNDMNVSNGNPSLTGQLHGKTVAAYDGDDTTATTKNFSNDLDQSGYSIVALSRYAGNPRFRVISSGYSGGSRNWLLGHHDGKHSTFFAENWVDPGTTGDLNWHIFSVTHEPAISNNNGSAPLSSFWLDGTNRVQNSGLSSDSAPSPSDIVFGGALTTERSNCEVAEFIMIAAEISDTKRQEIEGYLAHKWGLRSILPNNHFYK
jgi:N-acetylneuraminic acid mutarotase